MSDHSKINPKSSGKKAYDGSEIGRDPVQQDIIARMKSAITDDEFHYWKRLLTR